LNTVKRTYKGSFGGAVMVFLLRRLDTALLFEEDLEELTL